MAYNIYILYSEKTDRYYVGATENLEVRLAQHNAGRSKSTKAGVPWVLRYTEAYETRSAAALRETEIKKKKSRKYIEQLLNETG